MTCGAPIVIGSLPYNTTDNTSNYADNYDITQPTACAGTAVNYMVGNDVFYSYTAPANGTINIRMTPTVNGSGIFVYDNTCPGAGVPCVGGAAGNNTTVRNFNISVVAGHQYTIVISSSNVNQTVGYNLVIQEFFCAAPALPTVNGITQTSANFSWAAGSATTWEVLVQNSGQPFPTVSGTSTTVNTNSPSPIVLSPNTPYEVYVRAQCNDGVTYSPWIGPVSFRTLCDAFPAPFQEGFNSNSTTEPCWAVINGNNDANAWNMNYDQTPYEGDQSASISTATGSTNNDWLISPQITLNGNQRLKYRYRVGSATQQVSFRVMLSTGGTAQADFTETLVSQSAYTNVTYIERIVNLSAYTGTVNIAWHVPQGTPGGNRLFIDNVIIEDLPSCPEPTAVNVVANTVTYNSATIAWTNGGTETAWQVLALPCGSPAPTAGSTGWVNADSNSFNLATGLSSLTCYDVYVRAVCGTNDISLWSADPTTFTTEVAPPICGGNFVDSGGPTGNYAANSNSTVTVCANPGELVTVTFTSFNVQANNDALYVFDGNSTAAPQIASTNAAGGVPGGLAGGFWGTAIPGPFTSSAPGGCLTFNFRSDATTQNAGWFANVVCSPAPGCTKPSNLTTSVITSNSVDLTWIQHPNPDSSTATTWHVIAIPCGDPAPTATATGYLEFTTGSPYTVPGLDPNTCYDIYIRAACSATAFSDWSNVKNIRTSCVPYQVPFQEGFNSDSQSEACWTVLNLNNDTDSWNMNYTENPYEGDQVAVILTDGNGTGSNNNNDWLISPQITGLNGNQRLRYRYRVQSASEPNSFRVMLSQGSINPADFTTTIVPLANYSNTTYAETVVPLTGITGTINIGFHVPPSGPDGWRLYIDKVIVENIPTCFEPTSLEVLNTTATSAYLGWTDTNTPPATRWEVLVLPAPVIGDPLPSLPVNQDYVVSVNPVLITGLESSKDYVYYVRALCSDNDRSNWSLGASFSTKPANDLCVDAQFVPVNSSQVCNQVVSGVVTGAGPSTGVPFTCQGNPNDDVWYQFIATNSYLSVSLRNLVGTTQNLNFAVYSGSCGSLTQFACSDAGELSDVLNGLTVGNLYYIRVYSNSAQPQTVRFDLCITTPSTCSNAPTVCNITYGNTVGVDSLGSIGCLSSSPNPTFFVIQVTETGPLNYTLSQSSVLGGVADLDVDYAAWGPFTSQSAACSAINLPNGGFLAPGIGVPVSTTTGCSFLPDDIEYLNIVNAQEGQFYIILITNYSDDPGYISLIQTNQNQSGAGQTTCCPDAEFDYNKNEFCKAAGESNPIVTIRDNSIAGTFSVYPTTGLVFVSTATGEVDLMASAPGYYQITNTTPITEDCTSSRTYFNFIRITEPQLATITYNPVSEVCNNDTTTIPVTISGATNGTFSVLPQGGLYINPDTGLITPNLSSPGNYTVRYNLPGNGPCPSASGSTTIQIKAAPNVVTPGNQVVCDRYNLPSLIVGDYYTGPGGTGTQLTLPHTITETQTIYVYANVNSCIDEDSFTVTVNKVTGVDAIVTTQPTCANPTGTIEVVSPTGNNAVLPTDLFISEVTDHSTGSLTYVELYNGTGAPVNLANYKLKVYTFGVNPAPGTVPNFSCDLTLSGTIANNSTAVIKLSSSANQGGVTPNLTFTSCTGVNNNDYIKLTSTTDVDIDLWGKTDGSAYTPAGQAGYTYRRLNTATLPSLTWDPADWTALDPEDYTDVGNYIGLPPSGYEYSLDNGAYQAGTTFTGIAPGNHTIIVHDLATGCYSQPFDVVVNQPAAEVTTTFNSVAPICSGDVLSALPTVSLEGITGSWSPALDNTSTTEYTFTPDPGQCASTATLEIVVNQPVTPTFNAVSAICSGGTLNALPTTSLNGITGNWSPALNNTATTTYTFTPDSGQCASTTTLEIVVNQPVTPTFNAVSAICSGGTLSALPTTSLNGISGSWSPALNNTATTTYTFTPSVGECAVTTTLEIVVNQPVVPTFGAIDTTVCSEATIDPLPTTSLNGFTGSWLPALNNTATTTYTFTPTAGQCATSPTITIEVTPLPEFTITQGCVDNNYTLAAVESNSSSPSYAWYDASNNQIGTSQSVVVTASGTYKLVITQNGCSEEEEVEVANTLCSFDIQKGISANGDGYNDNFELTGFDVKKLQIFNRYGMKVYSRSNYTNEWYGQSDKGDELPDGTYYYVIDRNSGKTVTGWIYINREQ